jgi:aryl-alcohol dehydrogenase-like predicted oxidoreductase
MGTVLKRVLGKSSIEVSALGLGCWAIGGPAWRDGNAVGWGNVDDQESIRAIHRAIDAGVIFFDTADVYGAGHSERVLGRAIAGRRSQVVVATKFGNTFDEDTRQITGTDASEDYIRSACEASLRRINTDYIDLYQFHINNYDIELAAQVRDVLESLANEGKIRYYGWSTDFPERARVFAKGTRCISVQHRMNVLEDAAAMLEACNELNLASINRGPLAMGLLTGKYRADSVLPPDDVRGEKSPSWMRYFKNGRPNSDWLEKVEVIREILSSKGRTLAQGALAWIWGRSERCIPIPGFKTIAQIEQNTSAMEFGPLKNEQIEQIDSLLGR